MPNTLMQLVATGAMNETFPLNMAMSSSILDLTSNTPFLLLRISDIIVIDGFIIPTKINLDNIDSFTIDIGGTTIYEVPFDIIKISTNIDIKNDKYFIKFPHELFNIDASSIYLKNKLAIPLISLIYHEVRIGLNARNINNFDFQIIIKNIIYDDPMSRNIAQHPHAIKIYGYQPLKFNQIETCASLISTGLYIIVKSELINFKLHLQGTKCQEFNRDLIHFYSFLIHKKKSWTLKYKCALYSELTKHFPNELISIIESYIDKNNKYTYFIPFNTLNNNIDGTINFSRVDNIKIELETEGLCDGKVYSKHVNTLRVVGGMGGLHFAQ